MLGLHKDDLRISLRLIGLSKNIITSKSGYARKHLWLGVSEIGPITGSIITGI